jgi:IS30 family transposase
VNKHISKIEARRREVNQLLSRNWTQSQIAKRLGCNQSTISDDVRALKESAQDYIFGLAKNSIAFEYKVQ